MPKLVYTVEVDDDENGLEYLQAVQKAFVAITDLQVWGFTNDECVCNSIIDIETHQGIYDQENHA